MRYSLIIIAVVLLSSLSIGSTFAQTPQIWNRYNHFSYGIQVGTAFYEGDLDGNALDFSKDNRSSPWKQKSFRPAIGAQVNLYFNPFMHWRLAGNYGWIGGADSTSTGGGRPQRNLHFRTSVAEATLCLVIEPFARNDYARFRKNTAPYFFIGIGIFHFNPKAKADPSWEDKYPRLFPFKDEWHELQPLGTSGQYLPDEVRSFYNLPDPYMRTQICIPFGVGIRRKISRFVDLEFEFSLRKTFTDYLDDVGSTNYAPPEELIKINSPMAQRGFLFADRSVYAKYGESRSLNPNEDASQFYGASVYQGERRGNELNDDWYGFITIGITKRFQ